MDLRSRLDKLFAYRLSFVMSKYKDERVMFVKLVRVEITKKHLQSTTRSWREHDHLWGNYIERSHSARSAQARTADA